jgi:PB1 domain
LNLPVLDSDGSVIGIVDVLKLTYATLEQINQMSTPEGEGPMWNRFWNTLDNETESVHSGDGTSAIHSHRPETPSFHDHLTVPSPEHRFASETLAPHDSASITAIQDREDVMSSTEPSGPTTEKENSFIFKFKSPAGRVHRLRFDPTAGLETFRETLGDKLTREERAVIGGTVAEDAGFAISFVDDEGDIVSILSIADLLESVTIAKRSQKDKVDLYVHHPNQPPVAQVSTVTTSKSEIHEVSEKLVDTIGKGADRTKEQVVSGIPNELLLPSAIVVLAVVIAGIFIATRGARR